MSNPRSLTRIAVTGSSGKTATREMIAAVLRRKWKVLATTDNRNLPDHTEQTMLKVTPEHQAVVLELGMGKQGAGERHCRHVTPDISVITNIGTAHYGNLGNSIRSTAKFKSALIKHMNPRGMLLISKDDPNSRLLETRRFSGRILTVGIDKAADYRAEEVRYEPHGMSFVVQLNKRREVFFLPAFGRHNVYNALYAIAIAHQQRFAVADIRAGLAKYQVPVKRLNVHPLRRRSLLIDDTINANPQSMRAAIDVLCQLGRNRRKIAVLGTMLELGEYTERGHVQVGRYAAQKKVDALYTYGEEAKWIARGAAEAGYPASRIRHFTNRDHLHEALKEQYTDGQVFLVKGSSLTKMDETASHLLKRYNVHGNSRIVVHPSTLERHGITAKTVKLHFGSFCQTYPIEANTDVPPGKIYYPRKLNASLTIPDLPYEHYWKNGEFHLGPVIGLHIKALYYDDPDKQLRRFSRYKKIKGLIFLFKTSGIRKQEKLIDGLYYDPGKEAFIKGTLPYPSAIFNRARMSHETFRHLQLTIGDNIFNYPYGNVDKWEQWTLLSPDPVCGPHLPYTEAYRLSRLHKMLNFYKEVYIKPTSLAGGRGIVHVKQQGNGVVVKDDEGGVLTITRNALFHLLQAKLMSDKSYILQQAIPFTTPQHNKVDFRAYIQRDRYKKWAMRGMEAKIAHPGSIISNSKNRQCVLTGDLALRKYYGLSREQVKTKMAEIRTICIAMLEGLEKKWTHLGDAAVDLVIDHSGKVWMLEVQINYAAEIKADRGPDEQQVLRKILPYPFEYAKALTGFPIR